MDDDATDERRELEAIAFGRTSTREARDAALDRLHELDRRRAAAAVATLPPSRRRTGPRMATIRISSPLPAGGAGW
jgi:hypothetical protein